MSKTYNPDEMVDVLTPAEAAKHPGDVRTTGRIAVLPLKDAVRMVVVGWDGQLARQMSTVLARQTGEPINSLEEIRAIYLSIPYPIG